MNYNTIIFDLDGTLLDTLVDLMNSVNHTLQQYQFPPRSKQEIRSFVGNGVRMLLKRSFPCARTEKELDEALEIFRSHYAIHMNDNTCMYDGLASVLETLLKQNKNLAIVSNKLDSAVQILNKHYFADYIPYAVGTPKEHKKPDPYCIHRVMEHYQSNVSDTIYIGDSDVDIETAHNCGLKCIGVSWGFRGHDFLKEHHADYIADTPEDLLQLLLSL